MGLSKISCSNIPSPLLMFPIQQENNFCLLSLTNKRQHQFKVEKLHNYRFVGSSHGWLILLNQKAEPILHNIFTGILHQLPDIHGIPETHNKYSWDSSRTFRQLSVVKAVLSANPSQDGADCKVIVMYSVLCNSKLAFCRLGDRGWTCFGAGGEIKSYYDIVCNENMLYALGAGPSVEVWDLCESTPRRKMIIQSPSPPKLTEARQIYPSDLYSSQWYLGFSSGKMFLVVRYIGEFVRYDGEVVYEGDTLTDHSSQPLICPYRTVQFHVYEQDFDKKLWLPVESLNDYALFVGGNHTVLLPAKEHPGCKENAIYFTDDYWDRMDEDYCYGGHDMGIFKLGDGSIEPLLVLDCDQERIEPPPFWIVPN